MHTDTAFKNEIWTAVTSCLYSDRHFNLRQSKATLKGLCICGVNFF